MDAGEDKDILLQKNALGYISEFESTLPDFLFRRQGPELVVRNHVRYSTTTRLCNLLETFQEWPQLLDPSLASLVRPLQEALLSIPQVQEERSSQHRRTQTTEIVSSSQAVCKILYTLSKVRSPKVVSRFLENGAEYLETAVVALAYRTPAADGSTWEEQYVYLLWIAHLLLTPFDLRTVASVEVSTENNNAFSQLPLSSMPPIAGQIARLALTLLSSASKAREAAVKVLSRLASRPDMIQLHFHTALLEHALSMIRSDCQLSIDPEPYRLIGHLSLLAGLLSILSTTQIPALIERTVRDILSMTNTQFSETNRLGQDAVTRKLIVKILRLSAVTAIQLAHHPPTGSEPDFLESTSEIAVDFLLQSLGDKDTPVRQAAAKALSVITAQLQPDMAADVVEAVVHSLTENVLLVDDRGSLTVEPEQSLKYSDASRMTRRDLSGTDPLRWHGLTLALAQLIFQHSVTFSRLPIALSSLVISLDFNQRTASGTSLGANVRDAANFGIWSVARKFSTDQLLRTRIAEARALALPESGGSVSSIQALAAELIIAATLDPAGNIRRGASAALQELIGRHPDTVIEGISLVQVVDYHAISLRTKAFTDVALSASKLSPLYWSSIIKGMMGWRGLEAADASSRRLAAGTIGAMLDLPTSSPSLSLVTPMYSRLKFSKAKSIARRHGLLLAIAAVIPRVPFDKDGNSSIRKLWHLVNPGVAFESKDLTSHTTRAELLIEGLLSVISALAISTAARLNIIANPDERILRSCEMCLALALERPEHEVIETASEAARNIFLLLDSTRKQTLVSNWIRSIDSRIANDQMIRTDNHFAILGAVFDRSSSNTWSSNCKDILTVTCRALETKSSVDVDVRVAALKALRRGIFNDCPFVTRPLSKCLKWALEDYSMNERGDIGSLVRLEALAVVQHTLPTGTFEDSGAPRELLSAVATLCGEKLDKVRFRAWSCMEQNWQRLGMMGSPLGEFVTMNQTTTEHFFLQLLHLSRIEWLRASILKGLCSSMGSGSESVLQASRAAMATFLTTCTAEEYQGLAASLFSLFHRVDMSLSHDDDLAIQEHFITPLLETLGFLLQAQLLGDDIAMEEVSWPKFVQLVQKSHFKSVNTQRLTAAVNMYKGLQFQEEACRPATTMLMRLMVHPQPRIRNAAADAFYLSTNPSQANEILVINWSNRPNDLKLHVEGLRRESQKAVLQHGPGNTA